MDQTTHEQIDQFSRPLDFLIYPKYRQIILDGFPFSGDKQDYKPVVELFDIVDAKTPDWNEINQAMEKIPDRLHFKKVYFKKDDTGDNAIKIEYIKTECSIILKQIFNDLKQYLKDHCCSERILNRCTLG